MLNRIVILVALLITPVTALAQWVEVDSGLPGKVYTLLADSDYLFAGSDSGVYRSSDDGITWMPAGLRNTQVTALAKGGSEMFAGSDKDVFLSTNEGLSWNAVNSLHGGSLDVQAILVCDSTVLVGVYQSSLERSTNSGITWSPVLTGPEGPFSFLLSGSLLFAGSQYGIVRSTDTGATWTSASNGLPAYSEVWGLARLGTMMFAGVSSAYDTSVYISTDSGSSWSGVGNGPSFVYSFAVLGSNIFAGDGSGDLFLSTDSGRDWSRASLTGLTDGISRIFSIVVRGPFLIMCADRNGVWRYPLSELIPTNAVVPATLSSTSLTAYPNPFSERATIRFSMLESGPAEVSIVNALGMEVARIFSGNLNAGEHSFFWDGRGFAPGMYECLVKMGGRLERVPMVLE